MKTILLLVLLLLNPFLLFSQAKQIANDRFYAPDESLVNAEYNEGRHFFENISNKGLSPKSGAHYINRNYELRFATSIYDVIEDSGYYYLTGHVRNPSPLPFDSVNNSLLFRLKLDSLGEIVWYFEDSLANGDHYMAYQHCIIKLKNNTLLSIGNVRNDYQNPKDYEIRMPVYINFDKDGNVIFSKLIADTVGRRSGFWPGDVIAEEDSGFTVVGLVGSQTRSWHVQDQFWYHDTTYVTIIRYDKHGNEMHRASHLPGGEPRTVGVYGLLKTPDGKYVVSGNKHIHSQSPPRRNFILCLDSSFNLLWKKTFGQSRQPFLNQTNIIKLSDNGYAFAVNHADTPYIYSGPETHYTIYYRVGLMDSEFNITRDTIFRLKAYIDSSKFGAGTIVEIQELSNGDLVVAARVYPPALVFWMDRNLAVYREKYYWLYDSGYTNQHLYNMRSAPDDGIMLVGLSLVSLYRGGWFVRTDSLGFSLPNGGDSLIHIGIEKYNNTHIKTELIAFPNPTTDYLTIQTKDNTPLPQGTLQIFNMQGALQMEINIPKHQSQLQLNLSHLPAGLYLGRIVSSNGDGGGFRFVKK